MLYKNSAGQYVTVIDQHPVNASASYYTRSQCKFFKGNTSNYQAMLFTLAVNANITFRNAEIDNIRAQASSLVFMNGGNYIGFFNTSIVRLDFPGGVILASYYASAISVVEFDGVYVTGLNRDYPYNAIAESGLLVLNLGPTNIVYIRNCVFEYNFMVNNPSKDFINAQVTHFEVTSSVFRACMGGVHFTLYDFGSIDLITITNVTFDSNFGNPGIFSIFHLSGVSNMVFGNNSFINNVAKTGDIFWLLSNNPVYAVLNLTMTNVNFTNNRVISNAKGGIVKFQDVGYVQIQGFIVSENLVFNSSFSYSMFTYMLKNGLINDTPGLHSDQNSTGVSTSYQVTFTSTTFLTITQFQMYTSEFTSSNGVLVSIESDFISPIQVTDSSFASLGSAEFSITATTQTFTMPVVIILNCDFLGPNLGGVFINFVPDSGGGIIVEDSRFLNNGKSNLYSSAISVYGWFINVTNCVFDGNQGSIGSGIYFWFLGNQTAVPDVSDRAVFIENCQFRNEFATFYGGDIYMQNGLNSFPLLLYIGNTSFTNSTALNRGGSIELDTITFSSITIENCDFVSSSGSQGGMVSVSYTTGIFLLSNSSFLDISIAGGSILQFSYLRIVPTQDTSITLSNVTIRNSDFYTGIYFNLHPDITVTTVSNGYHSNHGNVILNVQGSFIDSGSIFYNNSFDYSPCYYQAGLTSAVFVDTVFESNSAIDTIGTVMISSESIASFRNCRFEDNRAGNLTGVMQIEMGSSVIIRGCEFLQNSAAYAATLYLLDINSTVPLYIYDSVFIGNAGEGLLQMIGANVYAQNVTIQENQSKTIVGIMMIQSNLSLINSSIAQLTGTIGCVLYGVMGSGVVITGSSMSDITCEQESLLLLSNLNSSLNVTASSFSRMSSTTSSVINVGNTGQLLLDSVQISEIESPQAVFALQGINLSVVRSFFTTVTAVVFLAQGSQVEITNSTFVTVAALTEVGGVNCVNCISVSLDTLTFANMSATGTAGVDITGSDVVVSMTNCRFEGLLGGAHGALAVDSASFNLTNSWFIGNIATGTQSSGGAVFINATSSVLSGNEFSGNSATNGGAIYWTAAQPKLQSNVLEGNIAVYGNDYASYAVEIKLVNDTVPIGVSGQVFTGEIHVEMLDHYGQVVKTDNSSIAWMSSASTLTGNFKGNAYEGVFSFSQFIVTHAPDSDVNVTVFTSDLTLSFPIYLRSCVRGEILSNGACIICQSGSYSLTIGATVCFPCLLTAFCPGSFGLYPRPGYWRPDKFYNGTFECPRVSACLGSANQTNSTGVCADGYTGNMCQSCATNYTRDGKDLCSPCLSEESLIIELTFLGVGICAFLLVLVIASQASAGNPANISGTLFKIFLNYLHFTVLVGHFEMLWPKELKGLFNLYEYLGNSGEQFMVWSCVEDQPFYKEIMIVAVLPVALILISLGVWVIVKCLLRKNLKSLICALTITLIFIHPVVVRVACSAFSCIVIKPGEYWLRFEMDISCWDFTHFHYTLAAALPVLILWGFGFPFFTLLLLIKYRHRLREPAVRQSLGFLWVGCKPALFYWELVKIIWKVLIIVLYVFMSYQNLSLQALALCLLLWMSTVLQSRYQAFQRAVINKAELQSIWVSVVTAYSGIWYSSHTLSYTTEMVLFALVLFSHCCFIILWSVLMAKTLLSALKKTHPNWMEWVPQLLQQNIIDKSAMFPSTRQLPIYRTRGTEALSPSS